MSAATQLMRTYQEWRQLAEFEGGAIQSGNWPRVSDCQAKMRALQDDIISLTQEAHEEWDRPGVDREERERELRAAVQQVIEVELRNHTLLDSRMTVARAELDDLDQSRHNLKRIQRSYVSARQSAWSSFS